MKRNIKFHLILSIQNNIILLYQQWGFTKAPNHQQTPANMVKNALTTESVRMSIQPPRNRLKQAYKTGNP